MSTSGNHTERHTRYQHWLQTGVFLAALALLTMIVYTSILVQENRHAQNAQATAVPQTATARIIQSRYSTPVPLSKIAITAENAVQVQPLARWGQGAILAIAWSPDYQLLAVGSTEGVHLYDSRTGAELRRLASDTAAQYLAFSPDSEVLALGTTNNLVQLWQVADGTFLRTVEGLPGNIRALLYAPDGALLVAGEEGAGYAVWVWRTGALGVLDMPGTPPERALDQQEIPVAISADGRILAAAGPEGTVRLWQLETQTLLQVVQGRVRDAAAPKTVSCLALSPDGQVLGYAISRIASLFRLKDGVEQPLNFANTMAFSPDGQLLAIGENTSIRLLQVDQAQVTLMHTIDRLPGPVPTLAFSPHAELLAAALPAAGRVGVWEVSHGTAMPPVFNGMGELESAAFSPSGQTLATGALDSTIWLWNTSAGRPEQILQTGVSAPFSTFRLIFLPSSELLAIGTAGGSARLWRFGGNGDPQTVWMYQDAPTIHRMVFSRGGGFLAAGRDDGTVLLWQVSNGEPLHILTGQTAPVLGLAFAPDETLLATGSADGTTRIWQVTDGILLHSLAGPKGQIHEVSFSPDGQLLAATSADHTVRLWRVVDGALVQTLLMDPATVADIAFSPNGQILAVASAGADGTVQLWHVSDGLLLCSLQGHTGALREVLFSPDGALLAAISRDSIVQLWGVP